MTWRWLVLLASLAPLGYAIVFIGDFGPTGLTSFVLHLGAILWLMGLLAISLIDVFRNPRLDEATRTVWAVVLFVGNMLALPVYWVLYLRRVERPGAGAPAGLQNR